ncbi:MAG: hypothetical protein R3E79_55900 [Caldilineaceae bacterium]
MGSFIHPHLRQARPAAQTESRRLGFAFDHHFLQQQYVAAFVAIHHGVAVPPSTLRRQRRHDIRRAIRDLEVITVAPCRAPLPAAAQRYPAAELGPSGLQPEVTDLISV